MQRRNGCKYVCITPIDRVEDRASQQFVKAPQSGHISRSIQHRLKSIVHSIPRGSGRMNIISGKANKINQQEDHSKTEIHLAISLQIKPQTESYRHRHPAEIEHPGKEIGYRPVMYGKEFTRNQRSPIHGYTEKRLFRFIQALHINRVHLVIGIHPHPVIGNCKNNKRQ